MTQELRRLAEEEHEAMFYDRVSSGSKKYAELTKPAAILSLLDRLEKAEKDAERYRWLRSSTSAPATSTDYPICILAHANEVIWDEEIDAAIDTAMEASK